jgi:hypothetical protein
MGQRYVLPAGMAVFLSFVLCTSAQAVDMRDIETVRAKPVLDGKDLEIIDGFVAAAVRELVETTDFSSISNARSIIVASSASKTAGQAQYAQQFSESAYKHISAALQQAKDLIPEDRKFRITLNLLMLIDDMEDLRLAEISLDYVKEDNAAIRYWAVHSLSNPAVIEKLNSSGAAQADLVKRICARLKEVVDSSGAETLALMVDFAVKVKAPENEDLLLKIAETRIKSYAGWTVKFELMDAQLLTALAEKLKSANSPKSQEGRCFGQLFSYAIQRYIKGLDVLNAAQKEHLGSVLVEIERSCIGGITGKTQTTIKRAIETNDPKALLAEHNRLLGQANQPGELAAKLGSDYGKAGNGSTLTAPPALPDPPKN